MSRDFLVPRLPRYGNDQADTLGKLLTDFKGTSTWGEKRKASGHIRSLPVISAPFRSYPLPSGRFGKLGSSVFPPVPGSAGHGNGEFLLLIKSFISICRTFLLNWGEK